MFVFKACGILLLVGMSFSTKVMAMHADTNPPRALKRPSLPTFSSQRRVWNKRLQTTSHVDSLFRNSREADVSKCLLASSDARSIRGGGKAIISNNKNGQNKIVQALLEPAVMFHLVFAVCAVAGLALPVGPVGIRILLLVIGYNVALFTVASKNGYSEWLDIFKLLVPLSALMVFADWFQIIYQDILVYPDIGGPRIGPVSGFMVGLWTIALFPLMLLGRGVERSNRSDDGRKQKAAGFAVVTVASLALFALAEGNSWRISMWKTKNCRQLWGHMAYFCVPAEVILALATYAASFLLADSAFLAKFVAANLLFLIYVGACAIFYMVIDILPDGVACHAFQT